MHVSAIDIRFDKKARNYFVFTDVEILDTGGLAVPGTDVSVTITEPDGTTVSLHDTTGINGVVTFKVRSDLAGTYETTVTGVSKDGWIYNEATNTETSDSLTIP